MQNNLTFSRPVEMWPAEDLEKVNGCPVCGDSNRNLLYTGLTDRVFQCAPGEWTLYRCLNCRSAYLDPRPTIKSIGRVYQAYFTHEQIEEVDLSSQLRFGKLRLALRNGYLNKTFGYNLQPSNRLGYFLSLFFPLQRARESRAIRHLHKISALPKLLDVGCGNGRFIKQMKTMGWQGYGVEPDPAAVAIAKEAGLEITQGLLSHEDFAPDFFDAITINHVIEHLHDPYKTLRSCYHVLKPGGALFIATPNLDGLGQRIFTRDWLALDSPRHLILFQSSSIAYLVKKAGFDLSYLHTGFVANDFNYKASLAVHKNIMDPLNNLPSLNPKLKSQLLLNNLRAWLNPQKAEELVVMACKPFVGATKQREEINV